MGDPGKVWRSPRQSVASRQAMRSRKDGPLGLGDAQSPSPGQLFSRAPPGTAFLICNLG